MTRAELGIVAAIVAAVAVGCRAPNPSGTETNIGSADVTIAERAARRPSAETQLQGADAGQELCRMTEGDFSDMKAGLQLQMRAGDIALYSERGGLLCSEPAGLSGDCQVVRGKLVVVSRAGRPDVRIEAVAAAPYLLYGPDRLRCAPPPPPVR